MGERGGAVSSCQVGFCEERDGLGGKGRGLLHLRWMVICLRKRFTSWLDTILMRETLAGIDGENLTSLTVQDLVFESCLRLEHSSMHHCWSLHSEERATFWRGWDVARIRF